MAYRTISIPLKFNYVKFAQAIFVARSELGLTLRDVGILCDVHAVTVYDYEGCREKNMKIQNFLAFCNAFELDPREFFELEMS